MPPHLDILGIQLHHRIGYQSPNSGGSSPERFTVDFLVNGQSLRQLLDVAKHDLVSRFAADPQDNNQEAIDAFLMITPPEYEGETTLYECPLCADPGCGRYFLRITRGEDTYTWSGFGYDQGWGDAQIPQIDLATYQYIGPYTFSAAAYEQTIRQAAAQSPPPPGARDSSRANGPTRPT